MKESLSCARERLSTSKGDFETAFHARWCYFFHLMLHPWLGMNHSVISSPEVTFVIASFNSCLVGSAFGVIASLIRP